MAGYEKFTLKSFQEKLESGGYANLKGVNRGIGRMSEWDEDTREKARQMARKHFGDNEPAAAAPKAKKVSKTKKTEGTKKVKRVSKRALAKKAAQAAAAPAKKAKKAKQPKKAKKTSKTKASPKTYDPIEESNRIGLAAHQRLEAMDLAMRLGAPTEEVAKGARKAQQVLMQTLDTLRASVDGMAAATPPSEAEVRAVEAFRKSAQATLAAGGNGADPALVQPDGTTLSSGNV